MTKKEAKFKSWLEHEYKTQRADAQPEPAPPPQEVLKWLTEPTPAMKFLEWEQQLVKLVKKIMLNC